MNDFRKETPLISFVTPVYNYENGIGKHIESILEQSLRNIELVLVDDGSTDKSGEICDEYAKQDSRVNIIHQKNQGPAQAYNRGIEAAQGSFIVIVDQDDWVDKDIAKEYLQRQEDSKADIIQSSTVYVNEEEKVIGSFIAKERVLNNKSDILFEYFVTNSINSILTGCLIRKCLFNDIKYPQGALSGDICVFPQLLAKCSVVLQFGTILHYVLARKDSVSRKEIDVQKIIDKNNTTEFYVSFLRNEAPELVDFISYRKCLIDMGLYMGIRWGTDTELKKKLYDLYSDFQINYHKMVKSELYHSYLKKNRIKLFVFWLSPLLYNSLMELYAKLRGL